MQQKQKVSFTFHLKPPQFRVGEEGMMTYAPVSRGDDHSAPPNSPAMEGGKQVSAFWEKAIPCCYQ